MSIFKSFAGFAVGIVFGVVVSFALDSWQNYQVGQNVISAFVGDIETLMEQEEKDRPSWYRKIDSLDKVDALRNPGGRPWLMREAFDSARLVVFEANAGKLGLLPKPLPKEIARFHKKRPAGAGPRATDVVALAVWWVTREGGVAMAPCVRAG